MATGQLGAVFRQFNRLFSSGSISGLSEGQLLARFVEKKDEAAFEALVSRFGPMVLGVCRQMLADPHAADDAFQATFLVLVKRARSIRDTDLLGNWLYGVALKVAKRSRSDLARRRTREKEGQPVTAEPIGEIPSFDDLDLGPVLHEELAKLPEKYRVPMVLCFLDGQTCEDAARRLGWPVGTVKGRISRAKELLRERLSRRGVTASVALVATTLTKSVDAAVPAVLMNQTLKAAMGLAAGGAIAAAGLGSASAVALAEGVSTTMILSKIKLLAVVSGFVMTMAGGAMVMARQGVAPDGQDTKQATSGVQAKESPTTELKSTVANPAPRVNASENTDAVDKLIAAFSLPQEADDLAQTRVKLAKQSLARKLESYDARMTTVNDPLEMAKTYLDARLEAARDDQAARLKAIEDHVRILGGLLNQAGKSQNSGLHAGIDQIDAAYTEARLLLASARSGKDVTSVKGRRGGGPGQGVGSGLGPEKTVPAKSDPKGVSTTESDDLGKDTRILEELEKRVAMPFANDTPLEEVIKYIQTATTCQELVQGIPIYVDSKGLEEAGKTLNSPVRLSLDGVKLKTTLRLLLKQLDMGYYVKHGLVIIMYLEDDDFKDETQPGWREREASGGGQGGGGMMGGSVGGGLR